MSKAVRGTLDCFYDVVSPYSYIAFEALLQYESRLPVKINFKPVFNGAIMKQAENHAPASIKRKGTQMWVDMPLCADYYGIPYRNITNFNERVMKKKSTPAMRFLTACKQHESEKNYRTAIRALFKRLYAEDKDIFDESDIKKLFDELKLENREKLYDLATTKEIKDALIKTTNEAMDNGAFGVPWMTLKRDEDKAKIQLFGSDRIHILCHLLNVPFEGKLEMAKIE